MSGGSLFCIPTAALLNRAVFVNLDPANDNLLYKCHIDVEDLVSLEVVMEELKLGPNGGMMYCMEYLQANIQWLIDLLTPYVAKQYYVVIDCPGIPGNAASSHCGVSY